MIIETTSVRNRRKTSLGAGKRNREAFADDFSGYRED